MSLVLPFALVLTVGLIDAGRAVYAYNALSRAAREAARYGAVYGGSQHPGFNWAAEGNHAGPYTKPVPAGLPADTVVGAVIGASPVLDATEMTVQITSQVTGSVPHCTAFSPGCSTVRVAVTYTFKPVTPLFGSAEIPMAAVATATVE